MNIRKRHWVTVLAFGLLIMLLLACGQKEAPASAPVETATTKEAAAPTTAPAAPKAPPAEAPQPPAGKATYDTVFPLPDDVQNFMGEGGENMANFKTSLTLDEIMEFYRQALTAKGLTERPSLTVTSDTTFSMVFDGWPNGKALVIQGVDLGQSRNVNIRLEDV